MQIVCNVLSCQQNWDLKNNEMNNSMVLEYQGWTFTVPITEEEMVRILGKSVGDAESEAPSEEPLEDAVQPPAMFRAEPVLVDSRELRIQQMKAAARNPVPVAEDVDEDGFAQG